MAMGEFSASNQLRPLHIWHSCDWFVNNPSKCFEKRLFWLKKKLSIKKILTSKIIMGLLRPHPGTPKRAAFNIGMVNLLGFKKILK
jgi:hypothetical protein